jgi:hypothetical protein
MKRDLQIKFYSMKNRCYNENSPAYKIYGGKGIDICESWLSNPKSFIQWSIEQGYVMGQHIHRIDNSKGYCPDNCEYLNPEDHYGLQECKKKIRIKDESCFVNGYARCNKCGCKWKARDKKPVCCKKCGSYHYDEL